MSIIDRQLEEMKKVIRDPILLVTIIAVIISLIIFTLWPIYEVLVEGFLAKDGTFTLKYYQDVFRQSDNIAYRITSFCFGNGFYHVVRAARFCYLFSFRHKRC